MISSNSVLDSMNAMNMSSPSVSSSQTDKETFLKLLVTQLQYQDPINPMDSQQFMGQLAQFEDLEQSMNLNDNFESFLGFQAITQASSLIDKNVEAIAVNDGDEAAIVEGKVDEVILFGSTPILKLSNGSEVPLTAVVRVMG